MRKSARERFVEKVKPASSGCEEWQSTIHRDGYGKFWMDGRQGAAHRAGYELFVGPVPEGKWVLHTCDNRRCVKPGHLYVGTPTDNVRDKIERSPWWGRMKVPFSVVEQARRLVATGLTQQLVADRLGIKQAQVSRYVRGVQRLKR